MSREDFREGGLSPVRSGWKLWNSQAIEFGASLPEPLGGSIHAIDVLRLSKDRDVLIDRSVWDFNGLVDLVEAIEVEDRREIARLIKARTLLRTLELAS